jgi:hypothetical protein
MQRRHFQAIQVKPSTRKKDLHAHTEAKSADGHATWRQLPQIDEPRDQRCLCAIDCNTAALPFDGILED